MSNPDDNLDDKKDDGVEIYHRVNRLKLKAGASSVDDGPGRIDPKAVKRAQTVVEKREALYMSEVEKVLLALTSHWDKAKAAGTQEAAQKHLDKIYHNANHVKDLAATYEYELMQHFGMTLREFAQKIDILNKAHHIIVHAHLDVMWVVLRENIKDQGGPKAEELKKIVAMAIEKYS